MSLIVEVAGLPGIGKTTVCENIASRVCAAEHSSIPWYRRWVRRIYSDRLSLLLTAVRFRPVFRELHEAESHGLGRFFVFWMVNVVLKAATRSGAGKTADGDIPAAILLLMNGLVIRHFMARLEMATGGKSIVLDEGFVQCGLGAWLRAPGRVRCGVWRAYLSCVPKGVVCLVLNGGASDALLRTEARPRGARAVSLWEPVSEADQDWLGKQYRLMATLLESRALRSRVECIPVDAGTTLDDLTEDIIAKLENLGHRESWTIVPRS